MAWLTLSMKAVDVAAVGGRGGGTWEARQGEEWERRRERQMGAIPRVGLWAKWAATSWIAIAVHLGCASGHLEGAGNVLVA